MNHCKATSVPAHRFPQSGAAATVVARSFPNPTFVISVRDPLLVPHDCDLRNRVRDVLRSAGCNIVLDLAGVSRIDAAGVGELVRAYNMTIAADGVLRITNARDKVRALLELARLFDLMSSESVGVASVLE
jgi:anti-anti-sigma factor